MVPASEGVDDIKRWLSPPRTVVILRVSSVPDFQHEAPGEQAARGYCWTVAEPIREVVLIPRPCSWHASQRWEAVTEICHLSTRRGNDVIDVLWHDKGLQVVREGNNREGKPAQSASGRACSVAASCRAGLPRAGNARWKSDRRTNAENNPTRPGKKPPPIAYENQRDSLVIGLL